MIDTNGSPLRNPAFRRVWVGATVSAAGDAASWVALVAYALGPAHGSVATLAVLYTAPVAVGGLVAGWALDRYDRRRLLIADSLARAGVFATIPLAAAWGGISDVQIYLVAAVYGLLKMTSLAGFPALIPELVPPGQLMAANALESVSFGIAGLVGAVGAGVAVATVGPGYVIAFDAFSYVLFALCLAGVPNARQKPRARRGGGGLGPVLRLVARDPVLRTTTVMFVLFNIGEGALLVVLPERALEYGLGPGGYGYLFAAVTGGELLAALVLLPGGPGTATLRPAADHVDATFELATVADLGAAVARCRRLLDLDADPGTYEPVLAADPALAPLVAAVPGLRIPGTVDGAETALRLVLGRHAQAVGTLYAAAIAAASDLPVPPATARTVRALAERLAGGELSLDEGADRIATRRALLAVPGLGPTRVEDIMLHAVGDPDAFPTADVRTAAAAHGLPAETLAERAERWRPWRAYAAHLLWRTAPLRGRGD